MHCIVLMQYLEKSKFTEIFDLENFSYVLKKKKKRERKDMITKRVANFPCLFTRIRKES